MGSGEEQPAEVRVLFRVRRDGDCGDRQGEKKAAERAESLHTKNLPVLSSPACRGIEIPGMNRIECDFQSGAAIQRSRDSEDNAAQIRVHWLCANDEREKNGVTAVLQPLPEFPDLVVLSQIRQSAREKLF
jgi:hypothetical protein